jgi:eukaryotic-like serine/threonine-protein kinase
MQGPDKTKRMASLDVVDREELAAKAEARASNITFRPPPNVKPGTMIGDKYRIEREIGRGGFGVVVRAVHLTLDQRVAIKVLTEGDGLTDDEFEEDAARFRREAKATAALRSDHVVRILDVDVLESGYPYIVMEYLEGKTLHELIYSEGPLSVEDAVDHALQVLAALAEAHSVGIVHRDLKPANVLLTKGVGGVIRSKVLDFGVSKMLGAASQRLTKTGAVVGTVAYMSPEQMLDAKRVDGRADIWSVGLILYEALAKKHPFGSSSAGPKVVTAVLNDPVVPLRTFRQDIPPALENIVARLLEKNIDLRFPNAVEVAKALAPFAPLQSRPVIDEIRRAGAPSGAAAPSAGRDLTRSHSHGASLAGTKPSASTRQPKKSSAVLPVLIALVTAALVLGVLAGFVFDVKPKWLHKLPSIHHEPPPAPRASVPAPSPSAAPAAPSAMLSAPPPTIPAGGMNPSGAHSAKAARNDPKSDCNPPYVWDDVAKVKRYKPECL